MMVLIEDTTPPPCCASLPVLKENVGNLPLSRARFCIRIGYQAQLTLLSSLGGDFYSDDGLEDDAVAARVDTPT
jgi:hypothetical protein